MNKLCPKTIQPPMLNLDREIAKSMAGDTKNLDKDKCQKVNRCDSILVIIACYTNATDDNSFHTFFVYNLLSYNIFYANVRIVLNS